MKCCKKKSFAEHLDGYIQALHNTPIDCGEDGFVRAFYYEKNGDMAGWIYWCAFFAEKTTEKPKKCLDWYNC